jgi:CheY-like chemotaxis protein
LEARFVANERAGPPQRRPRVLVVDDDAALRFVCATVLGLEGYEVIEAANGQDALYLARTAAPDVMLLDLSMPVLDGFGVAAALRSDQRTRELPFVFLTGELDPRVIKQGGEAGAAGFFTKPFDPAVVCAFIRRIVEARLASPFEPSGSTPPSRRAAAGRP